MVFKCYFPSLIKVKMPSICGRQRDRPNAVGTYKQPEFTVKECIRGYFQVNNAIPFTEDVIGELKAR